jgi:GT2 family glycosyltransferase
MIKYGFLYSIILRIIYFFNRPDIAVCILFFNRVEQTIECIESFLPSGVPVYILDNCSDRHQRLKLDKFIEKYSRIKIFNSSVNLGIAKGRNFLINNSDEEWLFFVDNDIVIDSKNWMACFCKILSTHRNIDIVIPRLFNKHEKSYVNHPQMSVKENLIKIKNRLRDITNMFPGGASIISRSYFDRVGLYDNEIFIGFEDFELAVRALVSGHETVALVVNSIELIHDHKYSDDVADKTAAQTRYDEEMISNSEKRIYELHGVCIEGDWREWLEVQRKIFAGTDGHD